MAFSSTAAAAMDSHRDSVHVVEKGLWVLANLAAVDENKVSAVVVVVVVVVVVGIRMLV
jgi:hypothetical protein